MKRFALGSVVTLALVALPLLAFGHPHHNSAGHGGFGAGFLHPLLGLDHLLAMAGVGLWAAQQRSPGAIWLVPAAFLAVMVIGFGLGLATAPAALVEFGIVGSLAVVGVLVFVGRQFPLLPAVTLAGLFAVFHGHAHGAEMAAGLSGIAFGLGFALASALLLAAGAVAWRMTEARTLEKPVARSAGVALIAAGAVFLILLV